MIFMEHLAQNGVLYLSKLMFKSFVANFTKGDYHVYGTSMFMDINCYQMLLGHSKINK